MNAEPERAPSPPPLLAYTASQLDSKKGKGKGKASLQRSGKKTAAAAQLKRRRPQRATEPVVFDDAARHEFLTGFRKRKQARIENSKQKAKEREKEERRKTRSEAQKARKEQAAENVRMEKIAYGGGVEENEDDDEDEGGAREFSPSAFESEEHHTTVVVQEWNPDEEDKPAKSKAEKPVKKAQAQLLELPPSSRRMAKKLKNAGKRGGAGVADAREISRLIDDGEAPKVFEPAVYDHGKDLADGEQEGDGGKDAAKGKTAKKPAKFHYESKLERAKARAKIREDKAKFAERRKEERKRINMQKGLKRRRKK